MDRQINFDAAWESKVVERILHNLGLLLERSFSSVQELNRFRKELEREYEKIRDAGYSKSQEESSSGIVGYAFPVHDSSGSMAAAVHVSVLATRATRAHERKLLQVGRLCAEMI